MIALVRMLVFRYCNIYIYMVLYIITLYREYARERRMKPSGCKCKWLTYNELGRVIQLATEFYLLESKGLKPNSPHLTHFHV